MSPSSSAIIVSVNEMARTKARAGIAAARSERSSGRPVWSCPCREQSTNGAENGPAPALPRTVLAAATATGAACSAALAVEAGPMVERGQRRERPRRPRTRQCRLDERRHLLAQHRAAARQPLLHRILGQVELPRDVGDRLVLAVEEHHRLAVGFGHAGERFATESFPLHESRTASQGTSSRLVNRLRHRIERLRRPAAPQLAAHPAGGEVADDAAQPRAELRRLAQLAQSAPSGDECLLPRGIFVNVARLPVPL